MKSKYYEYLKSLNKDELINLLYTPQKCGKYLPYNSYRMVALRICYDGRLFRGVQNHRTIRSISGELENALYLSGLGESPIFCGRTDAGVSAINMIVSVKVKSVHLKPNLSNILQPDDYKEYAYDSILNEYLPDGIEITGWAPVPDDFNARFSCKQRHYKYYFVANMMSINRMESAAEQIKLMNNFYLLSTHSNPRARYDRKIDELKITPLINKSKTESNAQYSSKYEQIKVAYDKEGVLNTFIACKYNKNLDDLYCIDIKARSFLHNMVRKIVWVMMSCGRGNEFDLSYVGIADAHPLLFVGCKFDYPLNFIGNRYCAVKFAKEENICRVMHAIAEYRLRMFADDLPYLPAKYATQNSEKPNKKEE